MKSNDKKKNDLHNQAINIALAFGLILTQGWFADGIEGNKLFPWWSGGFQCDATCGPCFWILEIVLLVISLSCALILFQRRRTFLPLQSIRHRGKVDPHQVVVLTISYNSWKWTPTKLERDKGEPCMLPNDLPGSLQAMAVLGDREKFTWEQMLRALAVHQPELQRVILIGSKGKNGTVGKFEDCKEMIRHYFPLKESQIELREADFDSLEELLEIYRAVIEEERRRKRHLMIDVTGGTKVVSIAAAMVTLDHPEIEFQYVDTGGEKRAHSFNVITKSQDRGD